MVDYDDITQTLLIDQIKIQYDSSGEWHKYLKSSLRNPHSFVYPDKQNYSDIYRSREVDFINSTCLSKGYKIKHIDKITREENEDDKERFLFEIEKDSEKNLIEDKEALMRKIVYLFKESMYYYMSFSETDDLYEGKNKSTHIKRRDIKYNSQYELLKGLNDCIVSLHDSKDNKYQAIIMTSDFCGLFSPNYIRLTKYTDSFKAFLKDNNIQYYDLFEEEIRKNEFYKKKKEYFDHLKRSAYIPLTKGEISLANKKRLQKDFTVKSEIEEENKEANADSVKNQKNLNERTAKKEKGEDTQIKGKTEITEKEEKEEKEEKKKKEKKKKESLISDEKEDEEEDEVQGDEAERGNKSSQGKKRKRKDNKQEKKKKKKKKHMGKKKEERGKKKESSYDINNNNDNTNTNAEVKKPLLCLEEFGSVNPIEERSIDQKLNRNSGETEEILNYLNIKPEKDDINKQDIIPSDIKIFNLLNKKINSTEYIYKELKGDFMKEINLPNTFNYEVNMIGIHENFVKCFYRNVIKHINKRKEKIKVYHLITNFIFFYSKMHKTYINFDDMVHKDINKNFDYKSLTIQGCILPYNFFLFLKGLNLMSTYKLINTFYINVTYDERKNKCLHFLNITENKFFDNFKKFEHNIKSKFIYIHKFLQNIVPIHKYLISKGKIHRNLESLPFSYDANDVLQLTYNHQHENNEIILYDENLTTGDVNNFINEADRMKAPHVVSGKNTFLGNSIYAIYISNSIPSKGMLNIRNYFKIIDDKDIISIIKDITDLNDNQTKVLLKEKKLLFLLDLYEKNVVYQYLLFNTAFFGKYISVNRLFYINTYFKKTEKVKDIPLFRPSCYDELIQHIRKRKQEREMKKKRVRNLHTVDKMCNNFFKESFNKILNAKIKEGYSETVMHNLKNEDDIKKTIDALNLKTDAEMAESGNVGNVITETNLKENITVNVTATATATATTTTTTTTTTTDMKTTEVPGNNEEKDTKTMAPIVVESSLIINEEVVRKKNYDKLAICIFVFINDNAANFTSEEKEIRELTLNVLKNKENRIENGIKYVHKYRSNINDAVTLSEIEMRKNDENVTLHIIGLVLCNDIANHNLQRNIKQLYDLNNVLHKKYLDNKIEIITKVFTYYWIFDVHTYGTIFLKDKEKPHMLKETTDAAFELPYIMEWKDKPLWGYHIYIIKDFIHSKYTDDMLEQLSIEGIRVTLCQECFEVQTFEDDLKQILQLHNLELSDLKYMGHNIFLNTLFMVENGHLIYLSLMDTDNIKMTHSYNCITIEIYNSQVTFPSYHLGTPILNDTWLLEVLDKRMLVPYEDHFYKY